MKSAKRSAAAAPRGSIPQRRRQEPEAKLAAKIKAKAKPKAKRFRPAPWSASEATRLDEILCPYECMRRNRIPADRRKRFVAFASQALRRHINAQRNASALPDYERTRADICIMQKACDRLLELGLKGENQLWIWAACNPRRADSATPQFTKTGTVRKSTDAGMLHYSLVETAVIPTDREEWLLHPFRFFAHDLRRLSLALDSAAALLHGVGPTKSQEIGSLFGALYKAFRRTTRLKPSLHGPFRGVAEYAVARAYGKRIGREVLEKQLGVLHSAWAYHMHESEIEFASEYLLPDGTLPVPITCGPATPSADEEKPNLREKWAEEIELAEATFPGEWVLSSEAKDLQRTRTGGGKPSRSSPKK